MGREDNRDADLQCGKGLERELGLVGVRGRAGGDEGRGKGVDLIERQRVVEGLRERSFFEGGADVRAVTRLNSEDGASVSEIVFVGDASSSSEVGADTDSL